MLLNKITPALLEQLRQPTKLEAPPAAPPSSPPMVPRPFLISNGKMEGDYLITYPDGSLKQICPYKEGILEGVMRFYNTSGDLVRELSYCEGKLSGPCISYENGKIKVQSLYERGGRNGISSYHDAEGNLMATATYLNNQYDGPFSCYAPDGKIVKICSYKLGRLDGVSTTYYPNGNRMEEKFYANGVLQHTEKFSSKKD